MIITATLDADPVQFVQFTWSDDCQDVDFVAFGDRANDAVEELLEADVHLGLGMFGWTMEISSSSPYAS